jgi:hypothetical protein
VCPFYAAWVPSYELVLKKGEGLIFPPGFVHETKNVGDVCAASVTYQFEYPAPSVPTTLRHEIYFVSCRYCNMHSSR